MSLIFSTLPTFPKSLSQILYLFDFLLGFRPTRLQDPETSTITQSLIHYNNHSITEHLQYSLNHSFLLGLFNESQETEGETVNIASVGPVWHDLEKFRECLGLVSEKDNLSRYQI